jgi:Resolvase, N terminal domain
MGRGKKRRQPQTPTHGAHVIGYLRHSSVNQERSVPQQRAELKKRAAAEGWQLVAVFADEGKSGTTTEGRDDFRSSWARTGLSLPTQQAAE